MTTTLPRVSVGFGDTADDQLLATLDIDGLSLGDDVLMHEDDVYTCRGRVVRIDGRLAWIEPDWKTWDDRS